MLKITEAEAKYARLLVVDRLPAGLEIDNPALFDSGVDRGVRLVEARHRAGAMSNIATTVSSPRSIATTGQSAFFTLAYVVARGRRPAITSIPPPLPRTCIGPERFGRTAFGEIEVKAR